MAKYLSYNGLKKFFKKLVDYISTQISRQIDDQFLATHSKKGLMSSADKQRLDNAFTIASDYAADPTTIKDGYVAVLTAGSVDDNGTPYPPWRLKTGHQLLSDVPANAKFTDTVPRAGIGLQIVYDSKTGIFSYAHELVNNLTTQDTISEGSGNRTLKFGERFYIPSIYYDECGHITGQTTQSNRTALTLPANPNTWRSIIVGDATLSDTSTALTVKASGAASVSLSDGTLTIDAVDTTYSAAGSSPGLVKSGGDVTISDGVITVNDDSHNHIISNIDNLQSSLDAKLNTSLKGAANGLAELDSSGKVPSSQLPSYVDDVLEYNGKSSFPSSGETGKIYVDTSTNLTYRWSGSAYVEISASLALGTTSSTAYAGDKGAANASSIASLTTRVTNLEDTKATTSALSTHTSNTNNPHNVTKTQVGLSNVENTALSTWAGSSNIKTLGTITSGTWQGSAISISYIGDLSSKYLPLTGGIVTGSLTVKGATAASGGLSTTAATASTSVTSPKFMFDDNSYMTYNSTTGAVEIIC
jgi:hypothetical protein